jgi:YebC/PmpR family DNA-binding regulatory protein
MSGHNRWSKIKHKKEASDSKKSKVWTKMIREITVSTRAGGGDINGNPRLRTAVDKARGANMPNDTIDRAIKKGMGDLDGVQYEEFAYEVFGPGGTALLVEIMTDNRNRTAGELRSVITRHGGNLGASGSVAYMFKKLGTIVYEKAVVDENKATDAAIELGADDIRTEGESLVIVTEPKEFERIREGLAKAGLPEPHHAEVSMVPQNVVRLEGKEAVSAVKLVAALEDSDDVQNVYSNMDVDESVLESVG